jgi:hypothetical protein
MQVAQPADLGGVHLLRFGDLFVDEQSGWVHVCDSSCVLQTADEDGELFKCPLTGRLHSFIAAGGPCSDAAPAALPSSGQDPVEVVPTGLGTATTFHCAAAFCACNHVLCILFAGQCLATNVSHALHPIHPGSFFFHVDAVDHKQL